VNYNDIRALLDTQLLTATGLPELQTENTRLEVNKRDPFVRSTLLPAEPSDLGVGPNAPIGYKGLYQVDLFYPMGDTASVANTVAHAVQLVLPRGYMAALDGATVQVDMSWQETATVIDSWYVVPVVVRWSMFARTQ
jgi:hypothetical protein